MSIGYTFFVYVVICTSMGDAYSMIVAKESYSPLSRNHSFTVLAFYELSELLNTLFYARVPQLPIGTQVDPNSSTPFAILQAHIFLARDPLTFLTACLITRVNFLLQDNTVHAGLKQCENEACFSLQLS
jgi:hypothetical protein